MVAARMGVLVVIGGGIGMNDDICRNAGIADDKGEAGCWYVVFHGCFTLWLQRFRPALKQPIESMGFA